MLSTARDRQTQLNRIVNLKCSNRTKRQILEGFLKQLKEIAKNLPQSKRIETVTTEETVYSESPIQTKAIIADLEKNIIMKRDVKITMHEEIEEAEEELESVQKTVFLKQQLDDQVKRQIDKKMFSIEMGAFQEKKKQKDQQKIKEKKMSKNKTFSILPKKVLDFFH